MFNKIMIVNRLYKVLSYLAIVLLLCNCMNTFEFSYAGEESNTIGATYNNGTEAQVTKLDNVKNFTRRTKTVTVDETYQLDIGSDYNNGVILVTSKLPIVLGNIKESAYFNQALTEMEITSSELEDDYGAEDISIDGFTKEDGYRYAVLFTGTLSGEDYAIDNKTALIIRIKEAGINKEELRNALNESPTEESKKYYMNNDFWNGKTYLSGDDASFWSNYLSVRAEAEAMLAHDTVAQADVDNMVTRLQASIDALISTDNVNASELYAYIDYTRRMGGAEPVDYGAEGYGDTYVKYKEAYNEAIALRDSLYDDGEPSDINKASKQSDVDAALEKLKTAAKYAWTTSEQRRALRKYQSGQKYLPELILVADMLTEEDKAGYTEESWVALKEALSDAKTVSDKYAGKEMPDTAPDAYAAGSELDDAYKALYDAYYINLTPVGTIEVSLIVTDPMSARAGKDAGIAGYVGTVKLESGYTVSNALQKAGINLGENDKSNVFINGRFVDRGYVQSGSVSHMPDTQLDIKLHDGDKVRVAWNMDALTTTDMNSGWGIGELFQCIDDLNIMNFDESENGATLEVKAGQEFTLTTRLMNAVLGSSEEWSVASNMSFYISDSAEDDATNQKELNRLTSGINQIISGEDGKAKITLYNEGCYVITAYDLVADTMGHIDNAKGLDTAGTYHSTNAGAIIRVKVLPADDEAAVKEELIKELEAKAADMPEEQFRPENWTKIQDAVTEGKANINSAEDLGAARDAQQTAIKTIQKIQKATKEENETLPKTVREALNKLPDDMDLISVNVDNLVQDLITKYDSMSDYQKSLLTDEEKEKCEAVKERAASEEYQTPVTFKIEVKNEADTKAVTEALQAMADWMKAHPDQDGYCWDTWGNGNMYYSYTDPFGNNPRYLPVFGLVETNDGTADAAVPLKQTFIYTGLDHAAYLKVKTAEGHVFAVGDTGVTISDSEEEGKGVTFTLGSPYNYTASGHFAVKVGDTEYRLAGITYDGIDESDVKYDSWTVHDYEGNYKGIGQEQGKVQNVAFPNSYARFNMPFNDVTVTLNWEPVDVDKLKNNAKAAVNDAFDAYDPDDYFQEDFDQIEAIKDAAIEAIDEATLSTEVTPAKKQALADMADIETKADVIAAAKEAIEEKFNAVDTSEMNDAEKANLAKAKEDALKAAEKASDRDALAKAGTDADQAIEAVKKQAEDRQAKEKADAKAAQAVAEKIEALKDAADLTLDDSDAVKEAREAYDALTDNQKKLVPASDLQKLKNSEALEKALQDKKAAEEAAAKAEEEKKAAEEALKKAEEDKKAAEEAAKKAEEDKKAADEAAKKAEEEKKAAEEALKKAEADKKAAEEAKAKAEADLVKAEQDAFEILAKVKIKKVKGAKKKITVTWKKADGAKGYEILVAKNKKGTKAAKTYTVKKNAAKKVIKKLKKGKYFVKVRAYKTIKGNTIYGKYSKVKKVKVR